jgi:hypothetical protein
MGRGPRLGTQSTVDQRWCGHDATGHSRARKLASGGQARRGEGGEPVSKLTRAGGAMKRPGNSGEAAAGMMLSGGGALAQEREGGESGDGCGGGRRGLSPYIGVRGGARRRPAGVEATTVMVPHKSGPYHRGENGAAE